MIRHLLLALVLLSPLILRAQKVVVKGNVFDSENLQLPFANIIVIPDSIIVNSDEQGYFGTSLSKGQKQFIISYTGYQTLNISCNIKKDTTLTFVLSDRVDQLKEVVVSADRYTQGDVLATTRLSTNTLTQKDIIAMPLLLGEADVIKALQLLPGTLKGVEGSADIFVRGGAADQNLILLDDAPIYNTSHLFGFLSVFNPDIIEKVESINGAFPAEYGGRLSSIMDIRTKSSIPEKTKVSADVGLISSRAFIEQPVIKNKASFWIAGRRTYIDKVMKAVDQNLPYFFYDLNGKLIFKPNAQNEITFSHYSGSDVLDMFRDRNNDGIGAKTTYTSGNTSQSLQWRSMSIDDWNTSLSVTRTQYKYHINNVYLDDKLVAHSDIEDFGAKLILGKDSVWNGNIKTGVEFIRHSISPNVVNSAGSIAEMVSSRSTEGKYVDEFAAHFQYEFLLAPKVLVNAGLRTSVALIDNKQYTQPEPRVSFRYDLPHAQALKLSYSRMTQYMHRISNSAVSTPMDVWYPVTDSIKPQTCNQFAAAYQKYLNDSRIFVSAEGYYKDMRSLIGYEEGTNLLLNPDFQSKLIQGKGRAYGFEFLIRKESGKLTGWISYTLSWSWRQYDKINNGEWFHSRYDRRHNGAVVGQYALNKRIALSAVFEFISGARFTPIVGQYAVLAPTLTGVDLIPMYSGINAVKLADTHRLDVGIKWMSKPEKKFQWQWYLGVYNVYNRANPIGITIDRNSDGSLQYMQPGLFGLIPFVSYGFKF